MELENNQQSRKQKKSPAITPEQRQEFYRLRYAEGQMVKTIAEKFGVNRRTVRENIAKFADEIKAAYERKVDMSRLADSPQIGRDRFYAIADKYKLKLRNERRKPRTTDSRHNLPTYPNQVKDVIPTRPNQIWVADITYIVLWGLSGGSKERFAYLSLLMYSYTKEIVGYCLCETLSTEGPLEALRQALCRITLEQTRMLTHHSDRGCQYASFAYTNLLKEYGIAVSMTESGNPKDNAQAERLNSTIKNELLKGEKF